MRTLPENPDQPPKCGNCRKRIRLPAGDLKEKTNPLLANYYDNLDAILQGRYEKHGKDEQEETRRALEEANVRAHMEICPLSYIRGRSLRNSYIICDEAQNASRSLIRDVVTRSGANTKVVLAGDIDQVDSPSLDKHNNGLLFCMERMKGNKLAAVIQFDERHCVRSPLAETAIRLLKD
jgi:PhoH-like ATPase